MSPFVVALAVMAAAALFGGLAYHSHLLGKKRREALEHVADELRFSFSPEGDGALLSGLDGFHLFSIGHSKRMTNLLRGSTRDGKAAIFDYRYTTGSGKNRHTSHQTVLCFDLEGRALTRFCLRPERVWHKVGAWIGYNDIDFEAHPEFSKMYFLRGEDEQEIRRLFGRDLIAFFEKERNLCMDGGPGYLLLYREGHRVKPEEIRAFLSRGERALDLVDRSR